MEINLSSVGMEKGRQYETVITTLSPEGKRNAAPIGVICTWQRQYNMPYIQRKHHFRKHYFIKKNLL